MRSAWMPAQSDKSWPFLWIMKTRMDCAEMRAFELVYVCPESFSCSLFLEVEPAATGVKAASYQRWLNAMMLPESALIWRSYPLCACCVHSVTYRFLRCPQRAQGVKSAPYQCWLCGMTLGRRWYCHCFDWYYFDIVSNVPAGLDSLGIPIIIC